MPCGERQKTWANVPDGSTLELSLQPSDDEYAQRVCFKIDAGLLDDCDEIWPRTEVTPGPKTSRLESPRRYDVEIRLDFLGKTPTVVEVNARILKPDGSQHGSFFTTHHTGVNGDSCESRLAILTRKNS